MYDLYTYTQRLVHSREEPALRAGQQAGDTTHTHGTRRFTTNRIPHKRVAARDASAVASAPSRPSPERRLPRPRPLSTFSLHTHTHTRTYTHTTHTTLLHSPDWDSALPRLLLAMSHIPTRLGASASN